MWADRSGGYGLKKWPFAIHCISWNTKAMMFIIGHLIDQDRGNIWKVNVKILWPVLPVVPEGQCLPLFFSFKNSLSGPKSKLLYIGSPSNLYHVKTLFGPRSYYNYVILTSSCIKLHFSIHWISLNIIARMFIFGHLIDQGLGNIWKVDVKIIWPLLPVLLEGKFFPLFFFFKLPFPGQNPNFCTSDQLKIYTMLRPLLDVVHITITSSWRHHVSNYIPWRHLKRCSFQRSISTEKNRDQAEYLHVFKLGCVTSTIWREVTVTSSTVISTEQNNDRNIYRKKQRHDQAETEAKLVKKWYSVRKPIGRYITQKFGKLQSDLSDRPIRGSIAGQSEDLYLYTSTTANQKNGAADVRGAPH